ncbi:MAG: hypothetical protein WCW52_02505 [Elusimicrobiales bacterium]
MKKILFSVFFPAVAFSLPAAAQMMQVIPAPSTAAPEGLPLSTTPYFQQPQAVKPDMPSKPARYEDAKVPLSGIVLMPTAYRGRGNNSIGLGLDFNAAYYIGRLYGKNRYDWTIEKTNYLDRVGFWLLSADTKMLIQTEGRWRPAVASGVQAIFNFRDAPQPPINGTFNLTVKATGKTTNTYANAYLVLTKRLHRKLIANAGYSDGDMPKVLYQLSEFLSKQALTLNGTADPTIPSGMVFGGLMWLPKPNSPIGVEVLMPQGAPQNPKLFNFHLGTLLKMNFEISYLSFKGGWDLLGMFQFRYGYFPK